MHLKNSSAKWRPSCSSLNVLMNVWSCVITINARDNSNDYLATFFQVTPRNAVATGSSGSTTKSWQRAHYVNIVKAKYGSSVLYSAPLPEIILWMRPANERRRYTVTSSLIGWAHSQNDLWAHEDCFKASFESLVKKKGHNSHTFSRHEIYLIMSYFTPLVQITGIAHNISRWLGQFILKILTFALLILI